MFNCTKIHECKQQISNYKKRNIYKIKRFNKFSAHRLSRNIPVIAYTTTAEIRPNFLMWSAKPAPIYKPKIAVLVLYSISVKCILVSILLQ